MPHSHYTLCVSKKDIKFSAAHMTIFEDGKREKLHGHNYYVSLEIDMKAERTTSFIDFSKFKKPLREICKHWDEKFLLPARSPHLELIKHDSKEIEFRLSGDRFIIPSSDVLLLPLTNILTEFLAAEITQQLIERLTPQWVHDHLDKIKISLSETSGQGASYCYFT